MIADLLRPLWRWAMWRPLRFWSVVGAVLVVVSVSARLVSGGPVHQAPRPLPTHQPRPAAQPATPAPTSPAAAASVPPSPSLSPSRSEAPAAAAVIAGENFAAVWVSRGPGRAAQIRADATPALARQLAAAPAALNPATKVTGPAIVSSGSGRGVADLSVPTNAGPALITVRKIAGRWLAGSVMLARTGD